MPLKVRPIEQMSKAIAKCAIESAAYGKCILTDYQNVHKDMCLQEFMRLKNCYLKAASKSKS